MTKAFMDLFVAEDIYESPDLTREFAALLIELDDVEAPFVPQALAYASQPLAVDINRWRALGELAVQFDIYEVAASLLAGFKRWQDPHQLATLATLTSNPNASLELRSHVSQMVDAGGFQDAMTRIVRIRLKELEPASDLERTLDAQSWPGKYRPQTFSAVAPVVYLSDVDAPPDQYWKVAAALVDSGARIRRVSSDLSSLRDQAWASANFPVVVWGGSGRAHWRKLTGFENFPAVQVPPDLRQTLALARLVNDVAAAMPSGVLLDSRRAASFSSTDVFSPELLGEGAFDSAEMIFLGGASRSILQRLAKEALQPAGDRAQHHWAFDQLITLRLIQVFKSRNKHFRGPAQDLTRRLHDIAAASEVTQVAIDVHGQMYTDKGDGFESLVSGQRALDGVLLVDEALKSFKIGGGIVVPDLLRPSPRTAVDPSVLAGTPTIRERRVSARSIAEINLHGIDVLRSAYPELDPTEIGEGLRLGNQILAVRS
ncbi:DUF433 domain-containing protein [Aeromicrobium fastidiosum]|nr:DUF433 domain-containing protein [Aeromicrobium fastidiosum]